MDWVVQRNEPIYGAMPYRGDRSDVWDEEGSQDEIALVSQFFNPQSPVDDEIVPASVAKDIGTAERMRSKVGKINGLYIKDLKRTKLIEANEDTPYRMCYPSEIPKRLVCDEVKPFETPFRNGKSVKWKEILEDPEVIYELRMRNQRLVSDIVLAPTIRRRLVHHIRKNKIYGDGSYQVHDSDVFARAEVTSSDSDVFHQCSNMLYILENISAIFLLRLLIYSLCVKVFYPDMNYAKESSALRDVLMLRDLIYNQKTVYCYLNSEYADRPGYKHTLKQKEIVLEKIIGDGGSCEILWQDRAHSILVNIAVDQDLEDYVKWYFPRAAHAVRLSTSERAKLSKYLDRSKAEIFADAVRVYFSSWADCCEALKDKDHRVARNNYVRNFPPLQLFPRAFIVGDKAWNSVKNGRMTYRVMWLKHSFKYTGIVIIVLEYVPRSFQDDVVFEEHIEEVLSRNNIAIKRAYLKRFSRRLENIEELARTQLFRSIISELIHNHEWHRQYPVTPQDWRQLLSENLPWQWKLLDDEKNGDCETTSSVGEAELTFQDTECGLRMFHTLVDKQQGLEIWDGIDDPPQRVLLVLFAFFFYLLNLWFETSPREFTRVGYVLLKRWAVLNNAFINNFESAQDEDAVLLVIAKATGKTIFVKPIYCVSLNITKEVRVACDKFIRRLNNEQSMVARASRSVLNSLEIVDRTWTACYDASDDVDTSEGEISVQGWPVQHVEEVATRLLSMFHGSYIDCSDAINGRLLYGYGARYVEHVRKELRGRVVIDMDLLGERITLVGEDADLARMKFRYFAKNSHAFTITQRIEIAPPRYPNFMSKVLDVVGIGELREICGGAELKRLDFVSITFTGTLQQYDLLRNYLDEIDERIKTVTKSRLLPLCCADKDCGIPFAISDIKRLVLGDARLPWLNERKIRPLLESSIDCLLRANKSLIRCPSPDCFGIFTKKEVSDTPSTMRCDCCGRDVCDKCMMEPHEGVSCEVHAMLRSDHEASIQVYKNAHVGTVRDCPTVGCGAVLQKNGGCNHMCCTVCNIHFCWLCGFKSEVESKVYKHLKDEHGAIGDEWADLYPDMHVIGVEYRVNDMMRGPIFGEDEVHDIVEYVW
ncbi:unnamed protein product [Angiostrongylus costaricensis]|uniref:RBR-type E3 ubiquitin transferase n=1 Tax=Angiostrongylus costaricensis TaxID=334426 RepID=A0A158PDX5_ANGCS|nr:unnamed protein product [Angiostrongylus costaricensis]